MVKTSPGRADHMPAQRRARVLDFVRERGAATIHELAEDLRTSLSTIRRDLDQLTDEGYLERTHGGVLLRRAESTIFETEPSINAQLALRQKQAIGEVAASRLSAGASVLCDSSSTVLEAMRIVIRRQIRLTAVTNSLSIASLCTPAPSIRLIVPGGTVRPGTDVLYGPPGETFLQSLHADFCLLGIHCISGTLLTESSLEGANAKRLMIRCSRRTILLADSSKFQRPSFLDVGDLTELDELITDDGAPVDSLQAMADRNVKVTVVPSGPAPLDGQV